MSAALLQGCSADPFGLRFLQHDRKLPVKAHLLLAQLNPGLLRPRLPWPQLRRRDHASASLDFAHPLQIAQSPSAASRRNLLPQPFLSSTGDLGLQARSVQLMFKKHLATKLNALRLSLREEMLVSFKSRTAPPEAPSPRPLNFNARIALLPPSKGILTGHL